MFREWMLLNVIRVCPKSGRFVGFRFKHKWLWPMVGAAALIWFVVRVAPKPTRATYPCQQWVAPFAAGFLGWLLSLIGATWAFRRVGRLVGQNRFAVASLFFALGLCAVAWNAWSVTGNASAEVGVGVGLPTGTFVPADAPNTPVGVAKGLRPGRVSWIHNPNATSWTGTGNWYEDTFNDQAVINDMLRQVVLDVSGQSTVAAAWDALFRYNNIQRGKGNVGYQSTEKIAIKINMNSRYGLVGGNAKVDASPQVAYALLDQLVNVVGVPQANITIYDAKRLNTFETSVIKNKCSPAFPNVKYNTVGSFIADQITYSSAAITNANSRKLPSVVTSAEYLINSALLKRHGPVASSFGGNGQTAVTLCGKNHFGSIQAPDGLHETIRDWYWCRYLGNAASYNPVVDLMGSQKLGGKTVLYLMDGLYAGDSHAAVPKKWNMAPFNGDWPSSLFASQDPVAIDSVGLDFLNQEWGLMANADNYLHEAAWRDGSNKAPSGTEYKPDGVVLGSLGVHEHWNNATEKKYSRNLSTGNGIELVALHTGNNPPAIDSSPWADPNPVTMPNTTTAHVLAYDADNDPLTFTWSTVSGPGAVTFGANNGTATGMDCTAAFPAVGSYLLRVTVSDGKGGSVTGDVTVVVNSANTAPVIGSGPSATPNPVTLPNSTTVGVVATDAENDLLTFTWSTVSGPGTVTFGANNGTVTATSCTAAFPVAGSYLLRVTVSDGRGGSVSGDVTVTVMASTLPVVSVTTTDAEASEPNAAVNKGTAKYRFSRSGSTTSSLTVKYAMIGTASNSTDYTTLSGTATIAVGATYVDVTLTAKTDAVDEENETAIAELAPDAAYAIDSTKPSATVTIYNAAYANPTLKASVSDAEASEPNAAANKGTAKFRFTRVGSVYGALTVKYGMTGTASNSTDYSTLSGTATIAAGATYVDVTLTAKTDALDEENETAIAELAPDAAYVIDSTKASATVTIYDAEYGPPTVSASVTDAEASEPNATVNKGTAKYRFTRSGSLDAALTVKYAMIGTAANSSDYNTLTGTATIAAGATYVDVTLTAKTDAVDEENETAIAELAPDAAYVIDSTKPSATVTIYDAEYTLPQVSVTATDALASEPGAIVNNGTGKFRISRTGSLHAALVVKYAMSGTATKGADYTSLSGTATIAINAAYVDVTVTALADGVAEGSETAVMSLSPDAAYQVNAGAGSATVTITE